MNEELEKITEEIKVHLDHVGTAAWKAGKLIIGKDATVDQIANLLSTQWNIDREILKSSMNRVKKTWI